MEVYLNGDNEQPTTCPQCGSRTDFKEVSEMEQQHECLNVKCGYQFILSFEEEEICFS